MDKSQVPHVPDAVRRAIDIARRHPAVSQVGTLVFNGTSRKFEVPLSVKASLPNPWRPAGRSPSGVLVVEEIRADFPIEYPLRPPELSLRPDFSRENAHIQPWLTHDDRPVPCLVDGELSEALILEGFGELLNRMVVWLDRAAEGTLIDPEQGWEPTRRDQLDDVIVCDLMALRERIQEVGGHAVFPFGFMQSGTREDPRWCVGEVQLEELTIEQYEPGIFEMKATKGPSDLFVGRGPALLVWSHTDQMADTYLSENVTDLASLRERAKIYHCDRELDAALTRLKLWSEARGCDARTGLLVLLCARRPTKLINDESSIEVSPYLVWDCRLDTPEAGSVPVRPAGHRAHISPKLLARVSGCELSGKSNAWTLLGAGSLGSKIAMHLARSGFAPSLIVDKRLMSPHNAARHALIPDVKRSQISWMHPKSGLLANAMSQLGVPARAVSADIRDLLERTDEASEVFAPEISTVVNTTASLVVREALNAATNDVLPTRITELALYASGEIGLIGIEGPERNPRLGDLMSEYFAIAVENAELREKLFGEAGSPLERVPIGEGCGSETMVMTDARISIFAAGMAEFLSTCLSADLPMEQGKLVIGCLRQNGLGARWKEHCLPPVAVVRPDAAANWSIRVHERAAMKISEEVTRWPTVETGGVLLGRVSDAGQSISVVDVLPAPEDSKRSKCNFTLGTRGLKTGIDEYSNRAGGALYCVGTWHSHLDDSGPSVVDHQTAAAIAIARSTPSVLLIRTPKGFCALLADNVAPADSIAARS